MKNNCRVTVQIEYSDSDREEPRPEEPRYPYLDFCRTVFRLQQDLKEQENKKAGVVFKPNL